MTDTIAVDLNGLANAVWRATCLQCETRFASHVPGDIRMGSPRRARWIVLETNPSALQQRLPNGWELAPYSGDDLRGSSLRGANLLVPFHEVYAVRSDDDHLVGLPQLSYLPFVSQAREEATAELAHMHRLTYTEDPAGVPGKYADGALASITRSQTFSKERAGETHVHETFSAMAERGEVQLSLAYEQGGDMMIVADISLAVKLSCLVR